MIYNFYILFTFYLSILALEKMLPGLRILLVLPKCVCKVLVKPGNYPMNWQLHRKNCVLVRLDKSIQLKENENKISYSAWLDPHLGCPAVEFSLLDHLRQVDRYKGLSTLSPGISWYSLNNWGCWLLAHIFIRVRGSTHFESLWNLASSGPASACVSVSTYNLARSTF